MKVRGRGTYEKDEPPIVGAVERGGEAVLRVAKNFCNKFVRTLLGNIYEKEKEGKLWKIRFSNCLNPA
ncbi:hypothetical protein AKJ57_05005 [candidate division MSBL1 archaeon SCGC-AAA259A05]|uniref:Uncharacterized protein n=1 Tax=candidate division MSBL1 archaeon SCGC-AAA259A05 TaxID=1698259 RepID=A0A133U684_9EURY|nr:hypothetical protein AKJ57_05005 [candidate division MSBL1 archaeon SCGC-AAA259A05]